MTLQPAERPTFWRSVGEFLFGMAGLELSQHALEMRASIESLFMLAVIGDMIGVPVLPPYYNLRLLPYVVPQIATWKRRVLRERELADEHDYHLHGL
ncbi:MAG: hypothetical protein AABY97_05445 [Chloroflexota bacterium]